MKPAGPMRWQKSRLAYDTCASEQFSYLPFNETYDCVEPLLDFKDFKKYNSLLAQRLSPRIMMKSLNQVHNDPCLREPTFLARATRNWAPSF